MDGLGNDPQLALEIVKYLAYVPCPRETTASDRCARIIPKQKVAERHVELKHIVVDTRGCDLRTRTNSGHSASRPAITASKASGIAEIT
jgi:hypothetical protein